MTDYELKVLDELSKWQKKMQQTPSLFDNLTKRTQTKINSYIPEKVHQVVTTAIKQMTRAVITGAGFTTGKPIPMQSLAETEEEVRKLIRVYRNTAAAEGGVTGFGGILLSIADFPLWLTLKMKMLFDIARHYGFDTKDFSERMYILYIFQLTFSSQQRKNELFPAMKNWIETSRGLGDIHDFDWRSFQLEYRDYIDLAKLFQIIPVVGAPIGAFVNLRLTNKLGKMAMNAYRLRVVKEVKLLRG